MSESLLGLKVFQVLVATFMSGRNPMFFRSGRPVICYNWLIDIALITKNTI
jgi:hypothetical protein